MSLAECYGVLISAAKSTGESGLHSVRQSDKSEVEVVAQLCGYLSRVVVVEATYCEGTVSQQAMVGDVDDRNGQLEVLT